MIPIAGIVFKQDTVLLSIGSGSTTLTPTIIPSNATDKRLKWGSSNEKVAMVSNVGLVGPIAVGEADITVFSVVDTTKKATYTVKVTQGLSKLRYTAISGVVGVAITSASPTLLPNKSTAVYGINSGSKLPNGLSLNDSTGTISGTPTTGGRGEFTVMATGTGSYTGKVETTVNYHFAIGTNALTRLSYASLSGIVGSTRISATPTLSPNQSTASYAIKSGSTLPVGLNIDKTTGQITGTSTTAGKGTFVVVATGNGSYAGTVEATVSYNFPVRAIALTGLSYASLSGIVGSTRISATPTLSPNQSTASYAIKSGSTLPVGLNIDKTTGQITGTPTTGGRGEFTVMATGTGSYTDKAEAVVNYHFTTPISITRVSYSDINGVGGTSIAYTNPTLTPIGATVVYAIKSGSKLPDGLVIDENTGRISGSPTAGGSGSFFVKATGTGRYTGRVEDEVRYTFTNPPKPFINFAGGAPIATVSKIVQGYTTKFTTIGGSNVSWSSSNTSALTITQQGVVTAGASGMSTITASLSDSTKPTLQLTVQPLAGSAYHAVLRLRGFASKIYNTIKQMTTTGGVTNLSYTDESQNTPSSVTGYVLTTGSGNKLVVSKQAGRFTITMETYDQGDAVAVWIDWNADGWFYGDPWQNAQSTSDPDLKKRFYSTANEFYIITKGNAKTRQARFTVSIPAIARVGTMRMRTQCIYGPLTGDAKKYGFWANAITAQTKIGDTSVRDFQVQITD